MVLQNYAIQNTLKQGRQILNLVKNSQKPLNSKPLTVPLIFTPLTNRNDFLIKF